MIVCQACGTANPPGAGYCSKCARKLDEATQQAIVEERARHTATGLDWSKILVAGIGVVVLAAVIVFVVVHGL